MTVSTRYPTFSQSPFFTLQLYSYASKMSIGMQSKTPFYHTSELSGTLPVLKQYLPTIFESKCFNEGNLSFEDEVRDTEVGHLFEHILLEYLCQTKINSGAQEALYNGETSWDWLKDPKGYFHITLDVAFKDSFVFNLALQKSIALLNMIFEKKSH